MTTWTALTTLNSKTSAEDLGLAMERLIPEPTGIGVFEVEDGSGTWEVGGYFIEHPDEAALMLLTSAFGANDFVISEVPETDWVAHVRRELAPVEAGRFFVYGSHDADKVPEGSHALLIEAAMAFGTGHHGTTLGCLRALDALIDEGFIAHDVVDVGCGTAVLAMAAARMWPETVLASDIDSQAVDVAQANVLANALEGRVDVVEAAGFDHASLAGPFDLIFANILKGPLLALAPDLMGRLKPGGFAILSGILNEQADEVIDHYRAAGANLHHRQQIVDWTTLTLTTAS
ncbi:MAG: 50S ribosomal protein L11 methyltransferase [Paracoccaceae bacterium]